MRTLEQRSNVNSTVPVQYCRYELGSIMIGAQQARIFHSVLIPRDTNLLIKGNRDGAEAAVTTQ